DARLPDLGRQALERGDQQGQARATPAWLRVPRSLSRRDHHLANAGAARAVLRTRQLEEAPGGSRPADARLEDRLVLDRRDVPRLGRVRARRGGAVLMARSRDLRSARRVPAPDVAPARRLEEVGADLLPRGSLGEALIGALARRRTLASLRETVGASPQHRANPIQRGVDRGEL